MKAYIQLNPRDNVVVALRDLRRGTALDVDGREIVLADDIPFGHKIAVRAIQTGEGVFKYGLRIGSSTREIQPGSHVHTHNLASDYQT